MLITSARKRLIIFYTFTMLKTYRTEYARNMDTVVSTVYDMVNGKLFSVPKLILLPQIIAKQPMLVLKIFPFILMSDYIKSTIVATVTTEVERVNKKAKSVSAARIKHHACCKTLRGYFICVIVSSLMYRSHKY